MEAKDYLKDIQDIKQMMSQSSRFVSLSGLSGVLAGMYCLAGSWLAYKTIYSDPEAFGSDKEIVLTYDSIFKLLVIAVTIVVLSLVTCIVLSQRKAAKYNEKIWNQASRRLLINFGIPFLSGGFFILFLIEKEILNLVAPLTLLFYGLACVNASKYTLGDIRYLGVTMIVLGLLSTWFLNYGLVFWALGFGVCHILYGAMMYFKYDRTPAQS